MPDQKNPPTSMDDDVAEIIRQGEAGVAIAMQVLEATERVYLDAANATAPAPSTATTSSAW